MSAYTLSPSPSSKSLLQALDSPERLQEVFASFSTSRDGHEDTGRAAAIEDGQTLQTLERKLLLSAQLGLALLEKQQQLVTDNRSLQAKNGEFEASVSQLLDRLAQSYKENAQLIKRAERAQANLDASEASNRQLLITLEEDRKTIRRLTAGQDRSANARTLSTELDTLRQELQNEKRRSDSAEIRAKRAITKLHENDTRLTNVSQQLDKARDERLGKQAISASRNRSRPGSLSLPGNTSFAQEADSQDLCQAIESLRAENETLRGDIQQMTNLLDISRDQITSLQADQSDRAAFTPFVDDPDVASRTAGSEGFSDALFSPDPDNGSSAPTSVVEWQSNTPGMVRPLPHPGIGASSSAIGSKLSQRRRSQPRIPQGSSRRNGGRAMSVDLSNLMQRKLEDLEYDYSRRPTSPILGAGGRSLSPSLRPFALGTSVGSLSSSLGAGASSPALPTAHEDSREGESESSIVEGPTILEIAPSPVRPPYSGDGGLTTSSPARPATLALPRHLTREVATQTDSPETYTSSSQPSPMRSRTTASPLDARLPYPQYTSSILSSDAASEHEHMEAFANMHSQSFVGEVNRGNRTAALGSLIEHVVRLLTRIKGADISSFEQRLKRQNLPGDVSHLAKSAMRDILTEIEGLRNHFRQVLEQETMALHNESNLSSGEVSTESLMARRDFVTLVKLFRDILYELGRLRTIVNRVELEPQLAGKLREIESIQSATDLFGALSTPGDRSGTAASLLAPLSRLFYGGEAQFPPPAASKGQAKARPMLGNPRPSIRPVPKLSASSALANATVNIEFGGQGGVRRQVSIMPQAGDGGLAGVYKSSLGKTSGQTSRSGRKELNSIFAGGMLSPTDESWIRVGGRGTGAPPSCQSSSQYASNRLSQNVDAVIDNTTAGNNDEADFRPNLLERTLRPRGLSDSSIHSTFMSHANPSGRLLTPAGLALSSTASGRGALNTEETVKATMAKNARPSILGVRHLSATIAKSPSGVSPPPSPAPSPAGEALPATLSPSRRKSPHKSRALNVPSNPVSIGASESATVTSSGMLSKSAATSGLFANFGLGGWGGRTSGLASSYQEPSSMPPQGDAPKDRTPAGVRSASSGPPAHLPRKYPRRGPDV